MPGLAAEAERARNHRFGAVSMFDAIACPETTAQIPTAASATRLWRPVRVDAVSFRRPKPFVARETGPRRDESDLQVLCGHERSIVGSARAPWILVAGAVGLRRDRPTLGRRATVRGRGSRIREDPAGFRASSPHMLFFDVTLVGVSAVPSAAWLGDPIPEHTHAIVLLVEYNDHTEADNPVRELIRIWVRIARQR